MKTIPLSQGKVAIVDDGDYEYLLSFNWFLTPSGYACRNKLKAEGEGTVYMAKEIMAAGPDKRIDHIDRNKLNNQKANLRECTVAENAQNQGARGGTSAYKGVSWSKPHRKWRVQITARRKSMHIALFDSEEDAATVYNVAAQIFHGPFAFLNEI